MNIVPVPEVPNLLNNIAKRVGSVDYNIPKKDNMPHGFEN